MRNNLFRGGSDSLSMAHVAVVFPSEHRSCLYVLALENVLCLRITRVRPSIYVRDTALHPRSFQFQSYPRP